MNFLCLFIDEWRMIRDIFNIHKSHSPRSLGLLYVSLFNISKHISISVLFFITSVLFLFCWIFEKNSPRGRVLARFFCPGFALSLCPEGGGGGGGGNLPFQKIAQERSGLELTDTQLLPVLNF